MDSTQGFRFACQPGCSRCCDVEGYVYLTEDDLKRAARYLGISTAEFEKRYVYRTRHLIRLRKPKGAQNPAVPLSRRPGVLHSRSQTSTMPAFPVLARDGGKTSALGAKPLNRVPVSEWDR